MHIVAKAKPTGFQVPSYAALKSAAVILMLFTTGIAVPVIVVLCSRVRVLRRSYLRIIRELLITREVLDSPETVCRLLEHNQ